MTDNRDLLFTDICARLKYNVKVRYKCFHVHSVQGLTNNGLVVLRDETDKSITTDIKNIQPYLFPLSSMTEEQQIDLTKFVANGISGENIVYDWYNKNHFDYRGLILMGSAIDATGKNIY